MWCIDDMASARSHFEILLLRMCTFSIFYSNVAIYTSAQKWKKQTHQMWWLKSVTGWLSLLLPCYFFDFTNQITLQSTFDTSAAIGEFLVEELGIELSKVSLFPSQWFWKYLMIGFLILHQRVASFQSHLSGGDDQFCSKDSRSIQAGCSGEFFILATSKISSNSMDTFFRFFFGAVGMVAASVISIVV